MKQMGPQAPFELEEFDQSGAKGHQIQFKNLPFPVVPAWTVTKDQFVFGLSPKSVANHLSNLSASRSLADNELIKQALKQAQNPVIISYRDTKTEVQLLFSLLNQFMLWLL